MMLDDPDLARRREQWWIKAISVGYPGRGIGWISGRSEFEPLPCSVSQIDDPATWSGPVPIDERVRSGRATPG